MFQVLCTDKGSFSSVSWTPNTRKFWILLSSSRKSRFKASRYKISTFGLYSKMFPSFIYERKLKLWDKHFYITKESMTIILSRFCGKSSITISHKVSQFTKSVSSLLCENRSALSWFYKGSAEFFCPGRIWKIVSTRASKDLVFAQTLQTESLH